MSHPGPTHESSLLLTLEEVSQLISHSHDPHETLVNIVRLIKDRFQTEVCSVYLAEVEQGELVLGATLGLKQESVGRVRMRFTEGLTGLVAERMAPIMVSEASEHPRFKYFPEAGEDPYHSFLGVPLVESGLLQGVLVVQTRDPRQFSPNEVRMLVTVGAQLAPLVSEARLLEQIVAAAHEPRGAFIAVEPMPATLRGVSLSSGVGLGFAYTVNGFGEGVELTAASDPKSEKRRLAAAFTSARDEIHRLSQRISELVGEDHGAILQAQLMIMQDRAIEHDLTACLDAGATAEAALVQTLEKYVAAFQKLASTFFQERVFDLKDVFRRLYWHLSPRFKESEAISGRLVLVAREASVMDLFSVDLAKLAAVVVEHGGPQSHAAILARSLGVPMLSQVPDLLRHVHAGRKLFVDATAGVLHIDPSPEAARAAVPPEPCHTAFAGDEGISQAEQRGPRVEANINLVSEVAHAVRLHADGVGLYRTEFLFLARRTLPTEEEQVGTYRKVLDGLKGRPVNIRTFDLRPDKLAHVSHLSTAAAAPLDWRLVLESPLVQKLFKDQVRAILRAAAFGPARVLVPFVTRSEQLDFIMETLAESRAELDRDGLAHDPHVPVGVVIEVAGATALVGEWARQVDYFALGTNDLLASALGINRDDPVGTRRDDPLHPGLLRMIHEIIAAAHAGNRPVTVCGEMAADPEGALILSAFGADALSVAVNRLVETRHALSRAALPGGEHSADILRLRRADEVRDAVRAWAKPQ
jgi:phosphotransferase system enzyme I (PtsP)